MCVSKTATSVFRLMGRVPRAALLAICGVSIGAAVPLAGAADQRCGEYCLRVALPGLGFEGEDIASAVRSLGAAPAAGHAVADLAAAVGEAGGESLAVLTTAEGLRARQELGEKFACVAHVDGNHYVLLTQFNDDGTAAVIDPPQTYDLPLETLAQRWDGKALLISKKPLTPEADLPGPFPWRAVLLVLAGAFGLAGVGAWWARRPGRPAVAAALAAAVLLPGLGGCDAAADPATAPAGRGRRQRAAGGVRDPAARRGLRRRLAGRLHLHLSHHQPRDRPVADRKTVHQLRLHRGDRVRRGRRPRRNRRGAGDHRPQTGGGTQRQRGPSAPTTRTPRPPR